VPDVRKSYTPLKSSNVLIRYISCFILNNPLLSILSETLEHLNLLLVFLNSILLIGLAQTMFQMPVLWHDFKHEKLQGIQ